MTKYKEYFERMLKEEKQTFDEFAGLHFKYSQDQDKFQEEFNKNGAKVMEIIRIWENKLCSQTEKAGYGNYSTNLSEKFWTEVRKTYPLIDYVGVITKKDNFQIKKINL